MPNDSREAGPALRMTEPIVRTEPLGGIAAGASGDRRAARRVVSGDPGLRAGVEGTSRSLSGRARSRAGLDAIRPALVGLGCRAARGSSESPPDVALW